MRGKLTKFIDLGMRVNEYNSTELVDSCYLEIEVNKEKYITYPLTKTCHHSSKLGKIIRSLLGRNLTKEDYVEDKFDSSTLLGTKVYVELSNNRIVKVEAF